MECMEVEQVEQHVALHVQFWRLNTYLYARAQTTSCDAIRFATVRMKLGLAVDRAIPWCEARDCTGACEAGFAAVKGPDV